jgi:hypothetical protein
MNVLLLLPIGLAAFAALLLPLLIHLARRSEQRVVPFAALRWLRALPQPRRKFRLDEWLLLLLRILLLAALALLFAQPVLFGRADTAARVALAPGVDSVAARALPGTSQARWLRLAPGFPAIARDGSQAQVDPSAASTGATLPSLLRELDAQLPKGAPLTVVVPQTLNDADAQRPVLSRKVDWRVLPPSTTPAVPTAARVPAMTPALQVRFAPERADAVRYLRASGVAWALEDQPQAADGSTASTSPPASRVSTAALSAPLDASVSRLAWLAAGPVPAAVQQWVEHGGQLLLDSAAQWPGFARDAAVDWSDDNGPLLRTQRVGRGRVLQLQRPLLPAAMPALLEADFPQRLRDAFEVAPAAPTRVAAIDYAPTLGAHAWPERPQPLAPWLAWLIAALFLLERWLASGPRRSEAA